VGFKWEAVNFSHRDPSEQNGGVSHWNPNGIFHWGLDEEAKKVLKRFLKNVSDYIEVTPDKEGGGLYLNPYKS